MVHGAPNALLSDANRVDTIWYANNQLVWSQKTAKLQRNTANRPDFNQNCTNTNILDIRKIDTNNPKIYNVIHIGFVFLLPNGPGKRWKMCTQPRSGSVFNAENVSGMICIVLNYAL